ncbi:Copia protein, partial [Mucuna pruriens]
MNPIIERRSQRNRQRPMEDQLINLVLFSNYDPLTFDEVVQYLKWRKEMNEEMTSIERNNRHKAIDVKWMYKTKLKQNGEVDKLKTRLVVKGYKQNFDVDYKEIFAPVAQLDTIRLTIALAGQHLGLFSN